MVESALNHIKVLEDNDFSNFKLAARPLMFFGCRGYYGISDACDYPLHLGITEEGVDDRHYKVINWNGPIMGRSW